MDQLFIIRHIMGKNWEHGLDLHMLFVDFKQAIDSVNRRKLLETMNVTQIPQKLIRLTEMTMMDMKAVVKVNNQKTNISEFKTDVEQGDWLSTTLFIIDLHKVIGKIDQKGTIFNK